MTADTSIHTSAGSPAGNREKIIRVRNGWHMLSVNLGLLVLGVFLFLLGISMSNNSSPEVVGVVTGVLGILMGVYALLMLIGHFTLQPNEARVLILFGAYKGTVRESGFHWANPFISKPKISLRSRNLNTDKLKVNDKTGNPVEIAAVVVWRVRDTAQAKFDVDDFEQFVELQSESAVRHLASAYAYDSGEADEITLRKGGDEINAALKSELQERSAKAGLEIEEARIAHLAYAPEIAQAMLRRQQAEAIIAAREKIVQGAVSMVEMALNELSRKQVVDLDEERKASMVSNLLVVLCSESEVSPVVNTGTLYS